MASVSLIFLGYTLFQPTQRIAQVVQCHADGFLARQVGVTIAFVGDKRLPDGGSAQTGVQPRTLETWIGLTLPIHHLPDIREQIRQMFFRSLATACRIVIDTGYAAVQFMQPFAYRIPVPAQFPLGL